MVLKHRLLGNYRDSIKASYSSQNGSHEFSSSVKNKKFSKFDPNVIFNSKKMNVLLLFPGVIQNK